MFASTFFFARLLTGIYDRQVYISQSCICSTHFHTCRIPWLLPRPNFKLMNFYSSQTWMNGPCSQETSIFLGESWWQSIEHRTAPRNPSTAASSHDPPKRAWCGKIAGGMVTVSWRVIFRIIIPNIPHVFVLRCFLNDVTFPRNCRNWYFWTPCYPICSNLWIENSTQILIAIEGLLHCHVWLQEDTNLSPWYQW